jgi:hypothetical protein
MLRYYGVRTLLDYFASLDGGIGSTSFAEFQAAHGEPVSLEWVNLGGQLVPEAKVGALRDAVRSGRLDSWGAIHGEYARFRAEYPLDTALNALEVLRFLEGGEERKPISGEGWNRCIDEALRIRRYIEEQVYRTKLKDYTDPFRAVTYRNEAERDAVLGALADTPFIATARRAGDDFRARAEAAISVVQ